MKRRMLSLFLATSCFVFCVMVLSNLSTIGGEAMELKIKSSAFNEGDMIPKKYTCDGADISPPLAWDAVPMNTKSVALISDDPDAPVVVVRDRAPVLGPPQPRQRVGGRMQDEVVRRIGQDGLVAPQNIA